MSDWVLHKSQNVIDNHEYMVRDLHRVHGHFLNAFPNKDSTWAYGMYNVFAATSPSPVFYELFKELSTHIRTFAGHDNPLWMQSWINYHMPTQVLDWHGHDWTFHGYISIDPKETKTMFEGYEIKNEIGNIYIGPGYRQHKVEVIEEFNTPRMTLGFDVHDEPALPFEQFSLVPIL